MASLCSRSDVLFALGLSGTIDAERDAILDTLIEAASDAIEAYCNKHFTQAEYLEEVYGNNTSFVFLSEPNPSKILFAAKTSENVIRIETTARLSVMWDDYTITIYDGETEYTNTFTDEQTLQDVVDYVNTVGTLIATLNNALYADLPAYSLYNETVAVSYPFTSFCDLYAATGHIELMPADDFFVSSRVIGGRERLKVRYIAGSDSVPSGINMAAVNMVTDMYNQLTNDGTKKSEKIGDYSYTNTDVAATTQALLDKRRALLDIYRVFSI